MNDGRVTDFGESGAGITVLSRLDCVVAVYYVLTVKLFVGKGFVGFRQTWRL